MYSDTYHSAGRDPPDRGHSAGRLAQCPRLLGLHREPPRAVRPRRASVYLAHGIEPLAGHRRRRDEPGVGSKLTINEQWTIDN